MDKKKIIIGAAIAIVILAAIVWFAFSAGKNTAQNEATGNTPASATNSAPVSATRAPAPATTTVLAVGAETTSSNIAVPQIVAKANPTGNASLRSFNITATGNKFAPSMINVNEGDTVNIEVSAVDKNYDFTQPDYGFNVPIPKGTTKQVQFEATASGKFTFYCASCGGPSSTAVGYITVVPKQNGK